MKFEFSGIIYPYFNNLNLAISVRENIHVLVEKYEEKKKNEKRRTGKEGEGKKRKTNQSDTIMILKSTFYIKSVYQFDVCDFYHILDH